MENKSFETDNIPADLTKSWHIPRPTLARSSKSSQGSSSPSSNNSTQSAKSGSLLLTAANLAQIQSMDQPEALDENSTRQQNLQYYLQQTNNDQLVIPIGSLKKPDPDSVSVASSAHFTVVNMNTRTPVKARSFCRKHQLTILVMTMSALFTIGIMAAIFLLELRAKRQMN